MKINLPRFFRRLARIIAAITILYGLALTFFYFKQEKFFFNPKHLEETYRFQFSEDFEEIEIEVAEKVALNAVLFKTEMSRGVVLYLHGNAGALHDWGKRAHLFLNNQYDVLFVDYRGYGKSDGVYTNDGELFKDVQTVYDYVKTRYEEQNIVVLGYSLGSGLAAYVAAKNSPRQLILNAPYYSWKTLVADEIVPPIPKFLVKYDIKTHEYLQTVRCPVQIFHGTKDLLIAPETNSIPLQQLFPEKVTLTLITDAPHNALHIVKEYQDGLRKVLLGE